MQHVAKKSLILSCTVFLGSICAHAQLAEAQVAAVRQTGQVMQKTVLPTHRLTFKQGLRLGGRSYISSSSRVGQELLLPVGTSVVGNAAQQRYLNSLQYTSVLGSKLSHTIAKHISSVDTPPFFPGFEVSFPEKWEQFVRTTHVTASSLSAILEAAFGLEALGEGFFVPSFEQVRRLSVVAVINPVPFEKAMQDALHQAQQVKNGFFVIRVAGNAKRPKDTLVLDLSGAGEDTPFRWLSVNQSRSQAWKALLTQAKVERATGALTIDLRATQGVMLRLDEAHLDCATVSADGVNWQHYPIVDFSGLKESVGYDILFALRRGYYIVLPAQEGGVVGFAQAAGKEVYSSLAEVKNLHD